MEDSFRQFYFIVRGDLTTVTRQGYVHYIYGHHVQQIGHGPCERRKETTPRVSTISSAIWGNERADAGRPNLFHEKIRFSGANGGRENTEHGGFIFLGL